MICCIVLFINKLKVGAAKAKVFKDIMTKIAKILGSLEAFEARKTIARGVKVSVNEL